MDFDLDHDKNHELAKKRNFFMTMVEVGQIKSVKVVHHKHFISKEKEFRAFFVDDKWRIVQQAPKYTKNFSDLKIRCFSPSLNQTKWAIPQNPKTPNL